MSDLLGIILIIVISISLPILIPLAGMFLMAYMILPTSESGDDET